MKTALLASYEKDANLIRLAKLLKDHGWELLASSGTAKYLADNGITARDVAEIVGKPILGHRVVTLSREIHAGLLSRPEDTDEMRRLNIAPIDLVYVTLYPLEKTIADPAAHASDILEQTDIGGPTLLRAAAKGRRFTLSDPAQIPFFEKFVVNGEPASERESLILRFAAAAERRVAEYVSTSAAYWEKQVM